MERASNKHDAPRCTTTYRLRSGAVLTTEHAHLTGEESYRVSKRLNERVTARSDFSPSAVRARMVEAMRRRGYRV
jgi:hypothetical protein